MDINKILSADILDIIFEGRNKQYGAYELRKQYPKRLGMALLALLGILLVVYGGSFLSDALSKKQTARQEVTDVELENVAKEEKKPEPPPPPPPKTPPPPPKVEIAKFTPPKIVKDEEVKPEDEIKEVEKLEDTKIGVINQEGAKDDGKVEMVEEKGTGPVEEVKKDETDYEQIFKKVEQEADFPGGRTAWQKYLERNLNSSAPTDAGAPGGLYTVSVTFVVERDGTITDVKAMNDPGYGTAEEAVRVIKKGPKWTPAVQNGRNVRFQAVQKVTFQVEEG
jgi:periplasmic protein TonB